MPAAGNDKDLTVLVAVKKGQQADGKPHVGKKCPGHMTAKGVRALTFSDRWKTTRWGHQSQMRGVTKSQGLCAKSQSQRVRKCNHVHIHTHERKPSALEEANLAVKVLGLATRDFEEQEVSAGSTSSWRQRSFIHRTGRRYHQVSRRIISSAPPSLVQGRHQKHRSRKDAAGVHLKGARLRHSTLCCHPLQGMKYLIRSD